MKEETINIVKKGNLLAEGLTTNYRLIKPGQDDFYNVDDFNQNMDTIDYQIKSLESQIEDMDASWDSITGKPDTFPPSSHGHTASEVSGLPTSLPANGGNADTVDGKHASDFAPNGFGLGQACVTPSGGDWNNALGTGFYMGSNQKNAPNTDWWMGYVIKHNDAYVIQIVNNFNNTRQWKQRFKTNGTWTAWEDFGGNGGDFVGKTLYMATGTLDKGQTYTFSNSKGGVLRLNTVIPQLTINVDGVNVADKIYPVDWWARLETDGETEIYIPFKSTVSITSITTSIYTHPRYKIAAYVNK